MEAINPHTFSRILVIRLSSIGDIVLTTPIIRTIHDAYPEITIDYMIKEQFRDLIEYHPAVHRVISIPPDFSFGDLLDFRKRLQTEQEYDFILDLHDNIRSRVLTLHGNIPYRRYDKHRFYRWLYVYWKILTSPIESYITDRYFEAAADLGVEDDNRGLDFYFPEDFSFRSGEVAEQFERFRKADYGITIAPGAAWETKRWLPQRFAKLCQQLIDEKGATIALLGGPAEHELIAGIREAIPSGEHVLNFTGRTSLLETAKILDQTALYIGNDSGLTHIATAFHKKVAVILGPTALPLVFYPKYTEHVIVEDPEMNCRPCTHMGRTSCPLGHFRCMKNIEVEDVLNGIRSLESV